MLQWNPPLLVAANTGAPLDSDGVRALASLRASAKRAGRTVGRFGVGFAAVAAVADEVVVVSRSGGVRFDRTATREAVAAVPELADELAARAGRVPLLRLPFPATGQLPVGVDTQVLVTVRPDAFDLVTRLLTEVDPALLLVLPGLDELALPHTALRREQVGGDDVRLAGVRWRVRRAEGALDPALLATRPVEEQSFAQWEITWAIPVDDAGRPQPLPVTAVVRAPTPTDDPMSAPALLAASLPLGRDRRRVQPGPLTEAVLAQAAAELAGLVSELADDPARLTFVPGPLAAGEVDAALGRPLLAALRQAPFLAGDRRPRDAVVLDGASPELVELLSGLLPGLLPAAWSAARWANQLGALGVRRFDLAGLTELLAGLDRPPAWWRRLYEALPPDRDALGALPVPLTSGRLAPGPRGLLIADSVVDLSPLRLPVVHPQAAAPLLLRLGAVQAEPRDLLADPRVRAAVEAAGQEEDPDPGALVEAVLALVGAAGLRAGDLPWLAALPLPTVDGDRRPAGELFLGDGPLARVVDLEAGFGVVRPGLAPDEVLAAVGVLRGFAVLAADEATDVDGLQEWLAELPPGAEPGAVVGDLDLVRPDAWPQALDLLERDGLLALPYVRWWLAGAPVLAGRVPRELRVPGTDPRLAGLFDDAPGDPDLAARLGAQTSLAAVLAADPQAVLDRLADPSRRLGRAQVRALHAALARAAPDVEPPAAVRAVLAGRLQVVDAQDAVVVDRPDLLARVRGAYVPVPVPVELAVALADLLDLPTASELLADAELPVEPTAPAGPAGAWAAHVGGDLAPPTGRVRAVERLVVPDAAGGQVEVDWAVVGDVDVVRGVAGTARALAWRHGAWHRRFELLARLGAEFDADDADLDPA